MNNLNDIICKKINNGLKGEITIPPDKSISHRSLIFGAQTGGKTGGKIKISNFSFGADCRATLEIIKALGCEVNFIDDRTLILNSPKEFCTPSKVLDCGNSGTSMRLLAGMLAAQNFKSTLIGDESLSKRPMKRVIEPLSLMGAKIKSNNFKAPLEIEGAKLNPIEYFSPIASAQVKSCILLAGLNTNGITTVYEKTLSRDHSERMFKYLEAQIETGQDKNGFYTKIQKSKLVPKDIEIAGDISSAAFFMVMAAIVPDSEIIIKSVGLNPTRTGILDVFDKMNVNYEILDKKIISNEEVGDIKVCYSPDMIGCEISGEIIPRLIDELPVIAVLAARAKGQTIVKDAQDLRNKESDRISALSEGLKKIGVEIEEKQDGFIINGNKKDLVGNCELETHLDHRLAMSFFVAGLVCKNEIKIKNFNWINTSFPEFLNLFNKISP